MVQSVPSPEMQAALDELMAAGIVTREDEPHGAIVYQASRDVNFAEFRRVVAERMLAGTMPGIRVFVPKAPTTA